MLPGPPLKAESLVVIIKDGGSVDLQEGPGHIRGWGCLAQTWGWEGYEAEGGRAEIVLLSSNL